MIVVDSHLDLSWNALNWNRDLALPLEEIRRAEAGMKDEHRGANTVCFPELRKAEVAVCLATVLARCTTEREPLLDYASQEIASAMGHGQRLYYRLMEEQGRMRMLRNRADLDAHMAAWQSGDRGTLGYILAMEGADPILSPADADRWFEAGLRVVGLSHFGVGVYAHGTGSPGGLTAQGLELLKAFQALGMVVDITHLMDEGFWEVMEKFKGPVLASHNNCRALVPGCRQLADEQIGALIGRGGVIGAVLDSWMLWPDYVPGQTDNSQVTMERMIDHIDHVCQLAGNARHAAIGSDLDGGFGREQSPADLESIADLQRIPAMLRERGYKDADVEAIMHGNWQRFFAAALEKGTA